MLNTNTYPNQFAKTNSFLFAMLMVLTATLTTAQTAPLKQWDARFGGSDFDFLNCLQQTADGGYILGGYSRSEIGGDKSQVCEGSWDYWIVKTDANGIKQWDARFGGSSDDYLYSLQQTLDGGYILGGFSSSGISGDKTQGSQGDEDYWIVKTDDNGVKQWDVRFGGSSYDILSSLQQTADGGYILGGYSNSGISGDKTQASQGSDDYWIVKTDVNGIKQWDARLGGSNDDYVSSLQQTADGGYILGGTSYSGISGDKTQASQGLTDYWIVKTDASGVKQWDATFGGSDDDPLISVRQTAEGGYILGGLSWSGISGDKTQVSQGEADYWIVRTDANGVRQWDVRFGGSFHDELHSVRQTADGGYILAGYSNSGISGDKTEASRGGNDYWIVKTDGNGIKKWDARFGGNSAEELQSLEQTADGGYILGGSSFSGITGDKTQASQGYDDYWIVKLAPDCNGGLTVYADADEDSYGNAANSLFVADCIIPADYVLNATDCNDANASIYPGAAETANGIDDNCNGIIDEGLCNTPSGLVAKNITTSSVKFKWDPFAGATAYKLRYKESSTGSWTLLSPNGQTKTVENLTANTNYTWQIKSVCGTDPKITSDWSAKQFFTTAPLKSSSEFETPSLEIYPNPFSNSAFISFSLPEATHITIELYDVAGRKLQTILDQNLAVGIHEVVFLRMQFSAGLYLLKVKMGEHVEVKKMVME